MDERTATLSPLDLIRQAAERRRRSGETSRSLQKAHSLSFIRNPRMPQRATMRGASAEGDLLSDIQAPSVKREEPPVSVLETLPGSRPRTSSQEKLSALWAARKALGLKPGEKVSMERLINLAAGGLKVRASTLRTFVYHDLSEGQRKALGTDARVEASEPSEPEEPVVEAVEPSPKPYKRGRTVELSYDERLRVLAQASVSLREGDAKKKVRIADLAAEACTAMKLSTVSARKFIQDLASGQRQTLGIATRISFR